MAGSAITDAILEAAEQLLGAEGMAGFTTNRVAEAAGVSVGSLYQYFPNKESILAEVSRRVERRTEERLRRAFEESRGLPLVETTAAVVDALIGQDIGTYRLRRTLRAEVPAAWTMDTSEGVDARVRSMLVEVLAHHPEVRPGSHALIAWIIAHSIEHAIEAVVLNRPELLEHPLFRQELIELATRYLRA